MKHNIKENTELRTRNKALEEELENMRQQMRALRMTQGLGE